MYLLNREQVKNAQAREDLLIDNFDEASLQHTFYYFHLGDQTERLGADGEWVPQPSLSADRPLTIANGECVRVKSLEEFRLRARLLGVLGGESDMAWKGLAVLHGPFVDPLFPNRPGTGPLRLSIVNHSGGPQTIDFEARIGKICFFDISDTYPVEQIKRTSPLGQKLAEREED